MSGVVSICNLKIPCIIGVHEHEQKTPQDLFVDLELDCDISKAAKSDDLSETIDYFFLKEYLQTLFEKHRFKLIESLAEFSCSEILKNWEKVNTCRIKIKKPGALPEADYAAVYIERKRQ